MAVVLIVLLGASLPSVLISSWVGWRSGLRGVGYSDAFGVAWAASIVVVTGALGAFTVFMMHSTGGSFRVEELAFASALSLLAAAVCTFLPTALATALAHRRALRHHREHRAQLEEIRTSLTDDPR